ncbi:MAG: DUF484 family protein [Pseudomonadota bacterium]|nr:DUF484 family protein [Pseudomonadota bacterium]
MSDISEENVIAYLLDHPDFLVRNDELVRYLAPPAVDWGKGVQDFQQFMVEKLQLDRTSLAKRQEALINTARANMSLQSRIHAGVLLLLEADDLDRILNIVAGDFAYLLDTDTATLVLESHLFPKDRDQMPGVIRTHSGEVAHFMDGNFAILERDIHGHPAIFGPAADLVRSQALIAMRFAGDIPNGILAFGSRDPGAFHEGLGTELVTLLARVLERMLTPWLNG